MKILEDAAGRKQNEGGDLVGFMCLRCALKRKASEMNEATEYITSTTPCVAGQLVLVLLVRNLTHLAKSVASSIQCVFELKDFDL